MSLFTDASLVMIPSGIKDQKVYSVTPTDGSGDLTFSRGSDIEATRVNANGYIEKAQVNLLLQSNQFDTTWTNSNTTETGGQSGYDGTNDAWLVTKSGANGYIGQNITQSGVTTLSAYAKANGSTYMQFLCDGGAYQFFDISNGIIAAGNAIDAQIESVGGGWYRCSMSQNASITRVRIYPAEVNTTSGTSGSIYIQDAQLNYGLVAQTYQETTTAAVVNGITNDMPRLSYDPANPTCPSLLLEPSRQNEMPNSEYLAGWTAFNNIAITQNQTTSPEGVTNGVLMARTGSGDLAGSLRYTGISTTANSKCFSVFAKANAHNYIQLNHSGDAQGYVNFDLSTGAVGTSGSKASGTIESYGSGWYRCTAIYDNTNAFGSSYYVGFAASASSGYAGGAVPDTASVYLYGAQIESSASYSSSYLPTYGSSATRTAEYSTGDVTSILSSNQGALFIHLNADADSGGYGSGALSIGLQDATSTNLVGWASNSPSPTELRGIYRVGGTTYYTGASTAINSECKILMKWGGGFVKFFKNGSLYNSQAVTNFTGQPLEDYLLPNQFRTGNFPIKQTLVFATALSDTDCETLTSL